MSRAHFWDITAVSALDKVVIKFRREGTEVASGRMVAVLQASAERGARIVRQILNFAQADEGGRGPLDLRLVMRELLLVVEETFPRAIRIDSQVPAMTPMVNANPTQLHQLLLNLTINARDAMPQGGTITVGARNAVADPNDGLGLEPGDYVVFAVADTGSGIAPDLLEQVTEPFFTTRNTGVGLGLTVARKIIEDHHGQLSIHVRSHPDDYDVRIRLPSVDTL